MEVLIFTPLNQDDLNLQNPTLMEPKDEDKVIPVRGANTDTEVLRGLKRRRKPSKDTTQAVIAQKRDIAYAIKCLQMKKPPREFLGGADRREEWLRTRRVRRRMRSHDRRGEAIPDVRRITNLNIAGYRIILDNILWIRKVKRGKEVRKRMVNIGVTGYKVFKFHADKQLKHLLYCIPEQ